MGILAALKVGYPSSVTYPASFTLEQRPDPPVMVFKITIINTDSFRRFQNSPITQSPGIISPGLSCYSTRIPSAAE